MRKIIWFIWLICGIVVAEGYQTMACSCAGRIQGAKGYQTCSSYWYSDAVFVGLAEKITVENGGMKVSFTVEKPIRGVSEKKVEVFTSASEASCGYPFKQGERYFVYGRGKDGKYSESLCGPTTLLRDAEEDLEYVSVVESGLSGSRIFGSVQEDRQGSLNDKRSIEPLPNIEIKIKSEKHEYKTRTDQRGFYIFKEIPADIYRVTAKFPSGLREIFRGVPHEHFASVRQDGIRCDGESFLVTRQGSIRGKVIDFPVNDIKNPWSPNSPQPKVTLLPLDENGKVQKYVAYEERWAYRDKYEFFFETVPAGRYLLAINPNNCAYPNNGIPAMYFPGTGAPSEAQIITVKEGENLVLSDFRSLPLLAEHWAEGTVMNADGSPAVNALVSITDAYLGTGKCSNYHSEVKTDESGKFRMKVFDSYEYKIEAYSDKKNGQKQTYARLPVIPKDQTAGEIRLILGDW